MYEQVTRVTKKLFSQSFEHGHICLSYDYTRKKKHLYCFFELLRCFFFSVFDPPTRHAIGAVASTGRQHAKRGSQPKRKTASMICVRASDFCRWRWETVTNELKLSFLPKEPGISVSQSTVRRLNKDE